MSKIRVLIADADAVFTANVRRALTRFRDIEIIGTAGRGGLALEMLASFQPDVLLTDIQLPELDGIALLKRCRRMRTPPVAIVCTRFYSDLCVKHACLNGASYILYKPIDFSRLPHIIEECWRSARDAIPESADPYMRPDARRHTHAKVLAALRDMGIPARLTGSAYIAEAAVCLQDDLRLLKNLKNGLYPLLARRSGASATGIEHALRNAIGIGFDRGGLKRHFSERPTNRDFLQYVVRRLDSSEDGDTVIDGINRANAPDDIL